MNFQEAYDNSSSIFLITLDDELGNCIAEIQDSDWFGGDEGSFTSDSNINFETIKSAESYYNRNFTQVIVFDDENERNEAQREMEEAGNWVD